MNHVLVRATDARPFLAIMLSSALLLGSTQQASAAQQTHQDINTSISDAISDIEIITVEGTVVPFKSVLSIESATSSDPDMRQPLSLLPGVSVNGNGSVSGIIQYRGLMGDRVNTNIDGANISAAGPNGMDSPLSHVLATGDQTITLYQGIAPVSAGAETIGGALSIAQRPIEYTDSSTYQVSGQLLLNAFEFGRRHAAVTTTVINQDNFVNIAADWQQGNNSQSGSGALIPSTFYQRSGVKISGGRQTESSSLTGFIMQRNTDESGTPALAMDIVYIDALLAGLNYQLKLNDDWNVQAHLRANNNEHIMNNFSLRDPTQMSQFRENYVDSEGRSARASISQSLASLTSEYGIEWHSKEHHSDITNPNMSAFYLHNFNQVNRQLYSVYGQWTDEQAHSYTWQVGGRLSQIDYQAEPVDSNMAMMNPNVAALRDVFNTASREQSFQLMDVVGKYREQLAPSEFWHISLGIKEQAPIYQQLYTWFPLGISAGLADGRNYLGNLELEKETAYKIDLGYILAGEQWQFTSSIYASQIDNYIMGMPTENIPADRIAMMNNTLSALTWQNQDARIVGWEFALGYEISSAWSLSLTGQYAQGQQTREISQPLYRLAPMTLDTILIWEPAHYGISIHTHISDTQNRVAVLQNETPTSGYAVTNLNGFYQWGEQLSVSLIVENIFNKDYADHLSGINRIENTAIPLGSKLPGTGRSIGVSLQYNY